MEYAIDALFISSTNLGQTCIQVFNLSSGKTCIKSFRGICASSNTLCSIGLNDYIICGQKDRPLLQVWSLNKTDALQMRFPVPGRVNVMDISHDFEKYCAVGIGEKIYLYLLHIGFQVCIIDRHYQDVTCLKFTSCGNYLASAGADGFVYLWSKQKFIASLHKPDRPQIEPHYILGQHSDKVTNLIITETGMRGVLITTSLDHSAKVFDLITGHLRHNIISQSELTACVCNAVGSQIFFSNSKGRVWALNLLPSFSRTDVELEGSGVLCHTSAIHFLSMTTSGNILITGGVDGDVKLWSIVMSEKKNFSPPSLAPQGTIWSGRGAISNLLVMNLDINVFSGPSFKSNVYISPFAKEDGETKCPLSAPLFHCLPDNQREDCIDESLLKNLAANLLSGDYKNETKKKRKKKKASSSLSEHSGMTDYDLTSYVQRLQENNEDLYKLCLKHVIGVD